jgi:glycosyltransferase involved in cell wall biosynthesis
MKPLCLIQGPFATRSGYGDKTRDLIRMILATDKYEVALLSMPWGACPQNALSADRDMEIIKRILPRPELPRQPEVFIQVSVPSEFQRVGKFNIGYTAGIETTLASQEWIEGCNRMDSVWVVSEHSKKVFEDTIVTHKNPDGSVAGVVKLERPIEIVPNAVDPSIFHRIESKDIPTSVANELSQIPEDFCFLFVGHWLKGGIGEDRKNVGLMIKVFCETFKRTLSSKRPALILKTSGADFSVLDQEEILFKIRQIRNSVEGDCPNVYLLHGDLSEQEMNGLYNHPKVKAHVSFTKGEGFGRPLLEATMSHKPVIASGWSGQLDFLNKDEAVLVGGELRPIEQGAVWEGVLIPQSSWFNVDTNHAASALYHVFKNYREFGGRCSELARRNKKNFSIQTVGAKVAALLERDVPQPQQFVEMSLPTLKKLG